MKDKIILIKSEGKEGCGECFIEELSAACFAIQDFSECNKHVYKLAEEEPVKIQTNPISKYEWYKDRLEIINDYMGELQCNNADPTEADKQLFKEIDWLKDYIKENKPTNFVPCTKKNTKVGDVVKNTMNACIYIIEHIFREMDCCSVWLPDEEKTIVNFTLDSFQIDLNNTEE